MKNIDLPEPSLDPYEMTVFPIRIPRHEKQALKERVDLLKLNLEGQTNTKHLTQAKLMRAALKLAMGKSDEQLLKAIKALGMD
jgi:hypothetical protein